MGVSPEAKELLIECAKSTKYAANALFPERFRRPFDPIHDRIFELIDNSDAQRKAIAVPRGLGKTSIVNLLLPAKSILLQEKNYIVPVSLSKDSAVEQTENLKAKLMEHQLVQRLYGDIQGREWSKEKWICEIGSQEIMVRPRGAGTQIRGLLFRDHRPDLIVVDDLEDPEEMDSPSQREKKKKWFYADLLNAVDRGSDDWEIIVLGTVLHQDSLLNNLLQSENWESVSLELCDDNFNSNAPNFMSDAEVKALYQRMKEDGELDVFFREYRNNPNITGEDAAFQPKQFKVYDEGDYNLNWNPDVENIVIVDPSRSAQPTANPSGIVGIGTNMNTQRIYVRECVSDRLQPEELYDEIERVINMINADVLAVEVTGLHEFVTHPLRTFLMQRGISIPLVELQAREGRTEKGKTARVRGLVDFYRQGLMRHNDSGVCEPLEQQLLSFPNAKNWSLMDPLGYLPEILEKGGRYLSPTPGETEFDETREEVEQEFSELDDEYYDEPLTQFRIYD